MRSSQRFRLTLLSPDEENRTIAEARRGMLGMRSLYGVGWLVAAIAMGSAAVPPDALAACCNVVNAGSDPIESVRVCEPDPAGACAAVLFEGTLAPGEAVEVCTDTEVIHHDRPDDSPDGRSAPTGADCLGTDVEQGGCLCAEGVHIP